MTKDPGRERTCRLPRWAYVVGIALITLLIVVVVMLFLVRGENGPMRHTPPDNPGSDPPPSLGPDGNHTPPEDGWPHG